MNIKGMKSVYLTAVFAVLIFSGVGLSLISFVSSVYAQIDSATIILDEPLRGVPVIDDENTSITPQGGLSSSQCTLQTTSTACLLVTKRVIDRQNFLTEAEEDALQVRVEVIVRGNVVTASDILRDGETLAVDINDGERYSVREVDNLEGAETSTG